MEIDSTLGQKITRLRESHNLSLEELSAKCGLDINVLQDLENGKLPLSLAPLIKITQAFGVRLGTLMDDVENLGPSYIDKISMVKLANWKGLQTNSGSGELNFYSLAPGRTSRHMDPFFITVEPNKEVTIDLSGHEGEEWLYGLEGKVEIEYGEEIFILKPGDSIYYDSVVPHQVRAHDGQKAKILACVYTPI